MAGALLITVFFVNLWFFSIYIQRCAGGPLAEPYSVIPPNSPPLSTSSLPTKYAEVHETLHLDEVQLACGKFGYDYQSVRRWATLKKLERCTLVLARKQFSNIFTLLAAWTVIYVLYLRA